MRSPLRNRTPYPPFARAFDRITVDGVNMACLEASAFFLERWERTGEHQDREIHRTLSDLLRTNSGMRATSSGTTGPPKKFTIVRTDLVRSARLTGHAFNLRPKDRVLHCLPCDFIAGKMMVVRAFALQLDIHFIDPRGSILEKLEPTERFRFTAMLPLQLHRIIQEDKARVERQFQTILLGGGPVSQALQEDLRGLNVEVFQSYGSTETVTHVALRRLNGPETEDAFRALGDVHFARDPRGCLVVYTPHLKVKQHVTNDLADVLDDHRFRWLGRYDNVILTGGRKIHPEQLEARTAGVLPYPHYFTAVPDDVLGQAIMLVLETDRPQEEVLPEVLNTLMTTLEPYELPRRVQALRRIQRTTAGKFIRG